MEQPIDINELENIPKAGMSEELQDKCDGARAKIARCYTEMIQTEYGQVPNMIQGPDGKQMPNPDGSTSWGKFSNGETEEVPVVFVETEPVSVGGEELKDALGQLIIIKERFNLKKHPITGKWAVSQHEKSNSAKLFAKLKVNKFPDCVGKEVILLRKTAPTSGKTFVGFGI